MAGNNIVEGNDEDTTTIALRDTLCRFPLGKTSKLLLLEAFNIPTRNRMSSPSFEMINKIALHYKND